MKILDIISAILLLIGGLNWGLVGGFDLDIVSSIFGPGTALSRLIFCLVGLSAIYGIFRWATCKKECSSR